MLPMSIWLKVLCYLLLVSISGIIQAKDKSFVAGEELKSNDEKPIHWQGKWLWGNQDHPMQLFRRSFEIKGKPLNATLHITASSVYQLYVNGIYIARGPARSAPHQQSYDTWQLNHLLTEGENVIAVKVHSQNSLPSYQHQTRAGLLAQLTLKTEDENTLIISDENCLTHVDESWDKNESRMSRFHQQVNDKVDLAKSIRDKSMKNWFQIDFNDNNWPQARVLRRHVGWPRPAKNDKASSYTAPWTQLVARDIPHLIENKVRAKQLVTAVHTDNYLHTQRKFPKKLTQITIVNLSNKVDKYIKSQLNNWRDGEGITLPKSDKPWLLVFDFGQVRNGMAYLKIKGSKGSKVEVISKPFMLNNELSYHTIDSNLIDKVLLSGEQDSWQATYFKPTRYLAIIVKANEQPVHLQDFGIHQISYPFSLKGQITSKQAPWLQQFMQASAKTIKAATTDALPIITENGVNIHKPVFMLL